MKNKAMLKRLLIVFLVVSMLLNSSSRVLATTVETISELYESENSETESLDTEKMETEVEEAEITEEIQDSEKAEEKQKFLWIINLSGALLNVAGNFILIPVLGSAGAAVASVATQCFTNVIMCLIVKPIRPTIRLMITSMNPKLLIEMLKVIKKK